MKQNGVLITKIFPNIPVSKRPPEQPLGKGKASVSYWVTPVKPGTIIFEIKSNFITLAKASLVSASYKFSIKTKIV